MSFQTSVKVFAALVMGGIVVTLAPCVHAQETQETQQAKLPIGIVTQKPSEPPFVALPDGRFMVPYTTTIPGTDVKFTMIPIPGGTFTMGSPESEPERRADEGPQFQVSVSPFWMGKYEVTWAEYQQFMQLQEHFKALQAKDLRIVTPENEIDGVTAPSPLYDPDFTYYNGDELNQPAATISQFAAKQYTKWLSLMSGQFYRLPTEAEWEYACRAGTTTPFYFGSDPSQLEEHAWFIDNSEEERHAVGQLKPNPWGLYDMYGNVAEWVLDRYSEDGYTHIKKETAQKGPIPAAQAFNQPNTVYSRVVRGGSWINDPVDCRSAARVASSEEWKLEDPNFPQSPWWFTDEPATGVGFRIIRVVDDGIDRKEKEKYWSADLDEIIDDARSRIEQNGRGAYGTVDPKLPEEIKNLKK